jgi:hypothetical protein
MDGSDGQCPLCQLEDEDTLHFLIKCNALYAYRKESMKKLKDIISDIDESVWRILSNDFNLLTNVNCGPDSMDGSDGQDCGFTES